MLALARQEWPDTSAYTEPEIVVRPSKRHHVALVVASHDYDRVQHLLGEYARRFEEDFLAVLPPMERAASEGSGRVMHDGRLGEASLPSRGVPPIKRRPSHQ